VTDPTFEREIRAAIHEAVDQQAPASLRASVVAMPDMFPAPNERSSTGHRMLYSGNLMVPIGLAAVVVIITISLGIIMRPWTNVGNPSPLPNATQVTPTPPVSSSVTGSMITVRQGHQAVLLADGRVLVTGGNMTSSSDDARSAEIYDPGTATWTPTASTTMGRPTLTLVADGRVLATGGFEPGARDVPVAIVAVAFAELYDPTTETWTVTGSLNQARLGHTATLLTDGRVLVAGGDAPAELYDPSTGTWTLTDNMVEARAGHTATLLLDGTVLVAGGSGGTVSAELYDPGTGTWHATGNMPQPHGEHTATLLADGKVLVVGGVRMGIPDRGLSLDESLRMAADIYDPSTGSWTAAGMMSEQRLYHGATLLPDGRLLVTGGHSGGEDGNRATAELYDPDTRTWSVTNGMAAARSWHTATLLVDGKILLAGGEWGGEYGNEPLASAELYDPGAGP